MNKQCVDIDEVLDLFGISDRDIYAKETIEDALYDGTLKIYDPPSAERRGRWNVRYNPGTGWYRITCSECGEDVTSTAPCIGFLPDVKVIWDYCPYCGAEMEADE